MLFLIFQFCFTQVKAQSNDVDRLNGIWIDTLSNYKYSILIEGTNIFICSKEQNELKYLLKFNEGVYWFEYSKREKIILSFSNNKNELWLNYYLKNEKYPISVPYFTELKYAFSPKNR